MLFKPVLWLPNGGLYGQKMPFLNFSTKDFSTLPKFSKFVTHVLSHRDNQIDVSSVELSFRGKVSQLFVKRILDYAFSHNVQQMTVTCLPDKNKIKFPLHLFNSQSLKYLTLIGQNFIFAMTTWELPSLTTLHLEHVIFCDEITDKRIGVFSKCANLKNLTLDFCSMKTDGVNPNIHIIPMSALDLPALTTLHLDSITLLDDNTETGVNLFSKCANLKNLILFWFKIMGSNSFSICHPTLSNLTLDSFAVEVEVVNVVAPKLENLTIKDYVGNFMISAPDLTSVLFENFYPIKFFTDGFHSLEKADVCVSSPSDADAHQIVSLLKQLHSVKFLSLNSGIVEILSPSMELIAHQPSPFANLKRLNIYPEKVAEWERRNEDVIIPTEVKNYFLDSSPNATFTMVTHKEITALKNAKSAQNLMGELQVLLEQCRKDIDSNMTRLDQGKTPMEGHKVEMNEQENEQPYTEKQRHFVGMMTQVERYWEDLNEQLLQGQEKTSRIISLSRKIEGLMTNVPPLQKANLQAMFSSLCAEADITMKKVIEFTKIQLIRRKAF